MNSDDIVRLGRRRWFVPQFVDWFQFRHGNKYLGMLSMNRSWCKKPGELYDKNGRPIYPGDLLKSFHFTGPRRKKYHLYHTAAYVEDAGVWAMRMVPTASLEPTKRDQGGDCLLSEELASQCEIIAGCGPDGCLDYMDRPRRKNASIGE